MATRCACACSARTSSPSATARAGSACSASTARTARRRWSSAATRNAGCAASITAGNSTWKATSSRCRPSRRQAASPSGSSTRPIPSQEAGGFVWVYMGPADADAGVRGAALGADAGCRARLDHRASSCPATGRRSWRGRSTAPIAPACTPPTCARPASPPPARADTHWTRPSTDKNPRIQVQITNYGMRYAAIRRPITNAATHDYVRITTFVAPFIALIPPNSCYNVASVIVPRDDTSSYFHFIAWGDRATCIDQEAWRKFCVAQAGIDLDARFQADAAPCRQQLPAGPHGDAAGQLHRPARHPEPGHRDVGVDGPDRRPHLRAARRHRHRGDPVPPR